MAPSQGGPPRPPAGEHPAGGSREWVPGKGDHGEEDEGQGQDETRAEAPEARQKGPGHDIPQPPGPRLGDGEHGQERGKEEEEASPQRPETEGALPFQPSPRPETGNAYQEGKDHDARAQEGGGALAEHFAHRPQEIPRREAFLQTPDQPHRYQGQENEEPQGEEADSRQLPSVVGLHHAFTCTTVTCTDLPAAAPPPPYLRPGP
jgi:hypothetical protein